MRVVFKEQWEKMQKNNCNKGKHHIRTNLFGVSWCTYCGLLSSSNNVDDMQEDDKIIIKLD